MTRAQRRRITFVLPGRGLAGGIRVVVIYGNHLVTQGHEVSIVVLRDRWPRRPANLTRRLLSEMRALVARPEDHLSSFAGRLIITRKDRLTSAVPDGDAVIATHCRTAHPVAALPAEKGTGFYFLQHYEAHTFDPAMVDDTWRLPLRKIVVANWLKRMALERFGDASAVLVPNAVDTEQFHAAPRGLGDPPCVGYMYSEKPWKGAVLAADAIARARKVVPNLRVVSFGEVSTEAAIPLPVGTVFHQRPEQDRIRAIYADADVWLLPSTTEGFGLPGLEAMACRCPVVATMCGGPEDFVEDGYNGYLVPVGDAEAMAERIVRIVTDGALYDRLAAGGAETATRLDWLAVSQRFEEAILQGIEEGVGV